MGAQTPPTSPMHCDSGGKFRLVLRREVVPSRKQEAKISDGTRAANHVWGNYGGMPGGNQLWLGMGHQEVIDGTGPLGVEGGNVASPFQGPQLYGSFCSAAGIGFDLGFSSR